MFRVELNQRQLFIDGYGVAATDNMQWQMHQPAKKGAVIRPQHGGLQTRSMPAWDPENEQYKIWVYSDGGDTVYESEDGLHWRPDVKQNIPVCHALRDDAEIIHFRRYKGVLLNDGFVFSQDGHRWRCAGGAPIPSQDEGNLSFSPKSGIFVHTAKRGGTFGRSVALATSKDYKNWEDYGVVFQTDEADQERCEELINDYMKDCPPLDVEVPSDSDLDWAWHNVDVYNMGVFDYEGLYIGMPAVYFRRGKRYSKCIICFTAIELACSRDLENWTRLGNRQPFIACSKPRMGAYDLSKNLPPSNALVRGDELWFYYTGIKYQGSQRKCDPDTAAVCLAVLRRDGFVSMDAGERGGSLVTEAFVAPGKKLFVNVDTYPDKDEAYWRYGAAFRESPQESIPDLELGELRVEVLDESGNVIAESASVRGDQPQAEVDWRKGNLATVAAGTIQLRFSVRAGCLYSYWFE